MTKLPAYTEHCEFFDRIVLFGGSSHTLTLLRLALVRSDNLLLVASRFDEAVHRHAKRMGIEHRPTRDGTELDGALTVLVADGQRGTEDAIIREAQFRSIPVYVADRPRPSDFTMLDFLYRRPWTLADQAPRLGRNRWKIPGRLGPAISAWAD